jgi:hypothetical protein
VTIETLRVIERIHALAAWAATAALLVAARVFASSSSLARRWARTAGTGAVALIVAAAALGLTLHDPYRARLRQRLFIASKALGWLFERKQHAAFAAVLLGVCALALAVTLDRRPVAPGSRDLTNAAVLAWTASAVLALLASIASSIVARRVHFG